MCVFSGLYLVNNVLMNAAANEFYSMGLVLTTFQDALSPMEQVSFLPMIDLHLDIYLQLTKPHLS